MRSVARALVAFVIVWGASSSGAWAAPATPAEQFVQDSADRAVAILKDKSLSDAQRKVKLWDFLSGVLDLKRTAMFALGPAAKTAAPDALAAYIDAYSRFALANYISEVNGYDGETVTVTGSTPRSDSDVIVKANVLHPTARAGAPPVAEVAFRVLNTDGKFAIVDASVMGIWFTVAQRDEYAGFLAQNKGDINALTARLTAMADRLQAANAPAAK